MALRNPSTATPEAIQKLAERNLDLIKENNELKSELAGVEHKLYLAEQALEDIHKTLNEDKITLGMIENCSRIAFHALGQLS